MRVGEWFRRARRGARRPACDRLRRGRYPHHRIAARRQGIDEGRGISAWHAAEAAGAAFLMPRYKLAIEYDGGPFAGWQLQADHPTVQGALEAAAKAIAGTEGRVHGAGRTDAGVHGAGRVPHCDVTKNLSPGRFRDAMNAHLRPNPIAVLSAEIVPDTFEARFSAVKRHY